MRSLLLIVTLESTLKYNFEYNFHTLCRDRGETWSVRKRLLLIVNKTDSEQHVREAEVVVERTF